ncbi:MAG: hypothetical protein V2J25_07285 [Desulfatiglans sp.]|nr:hypothetical protein [Desulfatiglans sp.]
MNPRDRGPFEHENKSKDQKENPEKMNDNRQVGKEIIGHGSGIVAD